MIYLILYVIFSSLFTLVIKWVHNQKGAYDIISVGMVNYLTAAAIMVVWALIQGGQTGDPGAMKLGGIMGVVYFVAFFFVIWCVRVVGASSTSVVSVLSMLIPIIFAAIVWGAQPTVLQAVGIAVAFFSLILIGLKPQGQLESASDEPKKATHPRLGTWILGGFFLLCGISRVCQEALNYVSEVSQKPTFLVAAFMATAIPSLLLLVWRKKAVVPVEVGAGVLMGLSNGLQLWLTLKALDEMKGFVFFPVSSAGTIIFTMFVAVLFLGEKIGPRALVGIGAAVIALVLMNM